MRIDELMIGNFVTINNAVYHPKMKGIPCAVTSISDKGDEYSISLIQIDRKPNTFYESYSQFLKYIEPIPITEEWLLKLGFNKMSGCFNFDRSKELGHHFGDFALSVYDTTQLKFWRGDRYCGVIVCEHIHELQNLFFSLTKEKLKIK
mgnify:FL=1